MSKDFTYQYETLRDIAEDCQKSRGCPNVESLEPWLRSYTYYSEAIECLSESEAKSAILEGYVLANAKEFDENTQLIKEAMVKKGGKRSAQVDINIAN